MSDEPVGEETRARYETRNEGKIAVITMDRPRYRNALSEQMREEMHGLFLRAEQDDDVRVIVLKGEGPVFSGGHDLKSPDREALREIRASQTVAQRYDRGRRTELDLLQHWRSIPKPTIAMVHGACIYAAWMVASAMDVIFAAEGTRFLGTNLAYFTMPWDFGARRSMYLLYEGRFLDAREAMEYGFVSKVFAPEDLEAETMAYAERVAENDPFQLRLMKHSIHQMQEMQGFTAHVLSSYADRQLRAADGNAPSASDRVSKAAKRADTEA